MSRSRSLVRGTLLAAILLAAVGCSDSVDDAGSTTGGTVAPTAVTTALHSAPPSSPYPVGESVHGIDVDGVRRNFLVYVPADMDRPRAVVFVLHGGGGEGLGVANVDEHPLSVFRAVADRENFVVIYPEGLPANDRRGLLGWVDCRADNTVSGGADDIGFLTTLVESFRDAYRLPASSIFMAGGSNGAQMTQAFAFHHSEMLGAVASSSGSLPEVPRPGPCTDGPAQPIPILLVHGTDDTQMPYDGGCVANLGGACSRGRVVSAEATRDRWLSINGLSGASPVATTLDLDPNDAGIANRFDYPGPTPVEWWRLDGAGHTGASRRVLIESNRIIGSQNRDIEFAEVAWDFFEQFLPPG